MKPYQWGMNGAKFGGERTTDRQGWPAAADQRHEPDDDDPPAAPTRAHLRPSSGLRKDTVLMAPMQSFAIDLDADNAGDWMIHCHNIYHAEAGMMIALEYAT